MDSQDINLCNTIIEKISDESQLAKIAMYAWDNSIRKIALENITNDNILAKIAFWDTQDKRIRVKETWLGGVLGGWKIREEAVKRITDEGILEKIALDYGFHENVEVRAKAVEKITDENILIKIACSRDEYNVTLRTSAVRTLANENISTELALKLSNDKICGRSNLEYIISKLTNIKSLEEIAIKRPDFRYDVDKRLEYLKLNQLGVDELEILALNSINNPEGYNEELAIGIIDRLSIQNGQKALENITIASIMKKAWDVSEVAINKLQNHLILSDILKSDQFLHHKVFSAALKNTFDISAVEYFLSRPANFNLFHQAKIKLEQLNFLRVLKAAGDESYYINTIKKHLTDEVILSFLAEDKDLPESIRDEAIKKLTIVKKKEMNESI